MIPLAPSSRTTRLPMRRGLLAVVMANCVGMTPARADDLDLLLGSSAAPAAIVNVGIDTPGDPAFMPGSAADSPAESSGPFGANRGDLGEDDDLSAEQRAVRRRGRRSVPREPSAADRTPDPLRGTERIDPAMTGPDVPQSIESLQPPRTDTWADWFAPLEPLHECGEPRLLPPCVPPPPCHPALPPRPYDLVGVKGGPTCGPLYRGPCAPRTGSHDDGPHPRVHRVHDRLFDWFYAPRTPVFP